MKKLGMSVDNRRIYRLAGLLAIVLSIAGSVACVLLDGLAIAVVAAALWIASTMGAEQMWKPIGAMVRRAMHIAFVIATVLAGLAHFGLAAVGDLSRFIVLGMSSAWLLASPAIGAVTSLRGRRNREPGLGEALVLYRNLLPDLLSEFRLGVSVAASQPKENLWQLLQRAFLVSVTLAGQILVVSQWIHTAAFMRRFEMQELRELESVSAGTVGVVAACGAAILLTMLVNP